MKNNESKIAVFKARIIMKIVEQTENVEAEKFQFVVNNS